MNSSAFADKWLMEGESEGGRARGAQKGNRTDKNINGFVNLARTYQVREYILAAVIFSERNFLLSHIFKYVLDVKLFSRFLEQNQYRSGKL